MTTFSSLISSRQSGSHQSSYFREELFENRFFFSFLFLTDLENSEDRVGFLKNYFPSSSSHCTLDLSLRDRACLLLIVFASRRMVFPLRLSLAEFLFGCSHSCSSGQIFLELLIILFCVDFFLIAIEMGRPLFLTEIRLRCPPTCATL